MAESVKVTDQLKEGEQKPARAIAKASNENFTGEQQAQPTEKFTTYSGEEPQKVLLAAKQGETLEEFTARTNQYHKDQERKAKEKPAIQPFSIGGFEDGSEVTSGGKQKSENLLPPAINPDLSHKPMSIDPRPSYIEGLKAIGNDEEAQGKYSIEYIERKAKEKHTEDQTLTNTPEGWLTAAQKIPQLPMDKQFQVIGSGLMAGIEQYQHDERERAIGQLIGTVQGTGEVLQGLAKIADFGAACLLGDNERAGKMGEEFGTVLGQTIVGGVRLFQASDQYLFNIGYTGDYAKPFRDIAAAGQKLDEQWSQLPPREQERIKAQLITELIESGAIGAGGASTVQKASKFTEVLGALAVEAKQLHTSAKPAIKKAVKAVNNVVDELVQPVGDTGMGVRMPIPKDPLKDETKMLMSKADDLDHGRPRRPNESAMKREPITDKFPPSNRFVAELQSVLEGLSEGEKGFLKRHGIEIKPVRRITDQFPMIRTQTAGCFDASERTIYLAEQVLSRGQWIPNNDLPFMARHEFGHAFNAKAHPFGDWISDQKGFIAAFNRDFGKLAPAKLDELQLSENYKSLVEARDEVFADMYGHAAGLRSGIKSNNPYSLKMREAFPNCFKYLEEI